MTSDGSFDVSNIKRSIGLLNISCHLYLTHRLLTPMITFQKGKKIILSRWIFNPCRFSRSMPVKNWKAIFLIKVLKRMLKATHSLFMINSFLIICYRYAHIHFRLSVKIHGILNTNVLSKYTADVTAAGYHKEIITIVRYHKLRYI